MDELGFYVFFSEHFADFKTTRFIATGEPAYHGRFLVVLWCYYVIVTHHFTTYGTVLHCGEMARLLWGLNHGPKVCAL